MKVLSVKDKKVARRLTDRLLKKGLVVAQAEKEEDLKRTYPRRRTWLSCFQRVYPKLLTNSGLFFQSGFTLTKSSR